MATLFKLKNGNIINLDAIKLIKNNRLCITVIFEDTICQNNETMEDKLTHYHYEVITEEDYDKIIELYCVRPNALKEHHCAWYDKEELRKQKGDIC
jgi:hypothetical protein